jgi:hypothetical protein
VPGLPALYDEINDLMTKLGVEPTQAQHPGTNTASSRAAGEQPSSSSPRAASSNALLLLQDVLRHRSGLPQAPATAATRQHR